MIRVVIPTRDRPEMLSRAVASVLDQGEECLEVVVVDDGSEVPLARDRLLSDPRVRVSRNEHPRGPAAARNQGAEGSSYDWLAFLDDDDIWLPGKLQHCFAAISEFPDAGMVFHRTVLENEMYVGTGDRYVLDDPVRRMLVQQPPHVNSIVIRRSVHQSVRFDESFPAAEDLDYLLRVATTTSIVEIDLALAVKYHEPSTPAIEIRIAGRKRWRDKHAGMFRDRSTRAFYEMRLGHLQRRAGSRGRALASFGRAALLTPADPRAWRGLAACLLPAGIAGNRSARVRRSAHPPLGGA